MDSLAGVALPECQVRRHGSTAAAAGCWFLFCFGLSNWPASPFIHFCFSESLLHQHQPTWRQYLCSVDFFPAAPRFIEKLNPSHATRTMQRPNSLASTASTDIVAAAASRGWLLRSRSQSGSSDAGGGGHTRRHSAMPLLAQSAPNSLEESLTTPFGTSLFVDFSQHEVSAENIMFWMAVQVLRRPIYMTRTRDLPFSCPVSLLSFFRPRLTFLCATLPPATTTNTNTHPPTHPPTSHLASLPTLLPAPMHALPQAFKAKFQHPAPRAYWKRAAPSAYAPFDPRVPAAAISLEPIPPEFFEVHAALAKPIPVFARSVSTSMESRTSVRGSVATAGIGTKVAGAAPSVLVRAQSASTPVAPRPLSVSDMPFQLLMYEDAQRIFDVFLADSSPLQV